MIPLFTSSIRIPPTVIFKHHMSTTLLSQASLIQSISPCVFAVKLNPGGLAHSPVQGLSSLMVDFAQKVNHSLPSDTLVTLTFNYTVGRDGVHAPNDKDPVCPDWPMRFTETLFGGPGKSF